MRKQWISLAATNYTDADVLRMHYCNGCTSNLPSSRFSTSAMMHSIHFCSHCLSKRQKSYKDKPERQPYKVWRLFLASIRRRFASHPLATAITQKMTWKQVGKTVMDTMSVHHQDSKWYAIRLTLKRTATLEELLEMDSSSCSMLVDVCPRRVYHRLHGSPVNIT